LCYGCKILHLLVGVFFVHQLSRISLAENNYDHSFSD
jgi:hypothetical protein